MCSGLKHHLEMARPTFTTSTDKEPGTKVGQEKIKVNTTISQSPCFHLSQTKNSLLLLKQLDYGPVCTCNADCRTTA